MILFWPPIFTTTFVYFAFAAKKELGSPAANVHLFECCEKFRNDYGITWEWEQKVGVPKPGYDIDGEPLKSAEAPAIEAANPVDQ